MNYFLIPLFLFSLSLSYAEKNTETVSDTALPTVEVEGTPIDDIDIDIEAYEKELEEKRARETEIMLKCPSAGYAMCEERFEGMYTSGFRRCLLECGLEPELYEEKNKED